MAAICLVCFILKLSKLILTDKIGIPLKLTAIVTSFIIQKGTINTITISFMFTFFHENWTCSIFLPTFYPNFLPIFCQIFSKKTQSFVNYLPNFLPIVCPSFANFLPVSISKNSYSMVSFLGLECHTIKLLDKKIENDRVENLINQQKEQSMNWLFHPDDQTDLMTRDCQLFPQIK